MVNKPEQVTKLWFEFMWSKPDLSIADKIVDSKYNPIWIHIDKTGPDQVKYEINYFRTLFPDLKYKIIEMISEEKKVWVRYKGCGTHLGIGWGFEATNKFVEFEGATILYINSEGKVKDQWSAFYFYEIFADLGTVPPFWGLNKYLGDFKQ